MQIVIDIPDEDVPNKQEIIDISLHFIAGEVCECSCPYIVLPKGHGDLIDRKELLERKYEIDSMYCMYDEVVNVDDIKDAYAIIEADTEESEERK